MLFKSWKSQIQFAHSTVNNLNTEILVLDRTHHVEHKSFSSDTVWLLLSEGISKLI